MKHARWINWNYLHSYIELRQDLKHFIILYVYLLSGDLKGQYTIAAVPIDNRNAMNNPNAAVPNVIGRKWSADV